MAKPLLLIIFILTSLFSFSQSRHIQDKTKRFVYSRDMGKCNCCGSSNKLEYDHIIPYSCGGNSSRNNIQLLCQRCNRSKSNSCVCKIHNRVVGNNCCNDLNEPKTSSSKQCIAITNKGARCKKKTKSSSQRCNLH